MKRGNIQHIKPEERQQASRLTPTPKKLAELIALVNLLPRTQELPSSTELTGQLLDQISSYPTDKSFVEAAITAHRNVISTLPEAVRDFIGPVDKKTFLEARERYDYLVDAQRILRRIAQGDKEGLSLPSSNELIRLEVGPDGQIIIKPTRLLEVLTEPGVSVFRIRECLICSKIFWAGRKDQLSCSKACAGALRTRRWRENYPEKYKLKRF